MTSHLLTTPFSNTGTTPLVINGRGFLALDAHAQKTARASLAPKRKRRRRGEAAAVPLSPLVAVPLPLLVAVPLSPLVMDLSLNTGFM